MSDKPAATVGALFDDLTRSEHKRSGAAAEDLTAAKERLFGGFREAQRALNRGCDSDIRSSPTLLARPLVVARTCLENELLGTSTLADKALRSHLLFAGCQDIVACCTRSVRDNADVRFRARFRMFAEAVHELECEFAEKARVVEPEGASRIKMPRRIAVPRVCLDDLPMPRQPDDSSAASINAWASDLTMLLTDRLREAVEDARREAVRRSTRSVARIVVRAARALHR
jgi:hypothetical protein